MIEAVHAVVLSGGSAFGLEASCGVMEALEENGVGFELGGMRVPIVVGACLFDLLVGERGNNGKAAHPTTAFGYAATRAALEKGDATPHDGSFASCAGEAHGNVGAGTGATVGKMLAPEQAMKSGLGHAYLRAGDLVVGAVVAVNALGSVCDEQGRWIAGCVGADGRVIAPAEVFSLMTNAHIDNTVGATPCENTTIGVVLTNARITKAQAKKTASTVHDAYARAIKPVHTLSDGDTVFCMASGDVAANPDAVSILATEAMEIAIRDAVRSACGSYGFPAACDLE